MDRYLGMGFSYNSETGAMTASMYHFCTSSLLEQSTPFTMDLFDISDDPTPVDSVTYQQCVDLLIWLLKLHFETHLAISMACTPKVTLPKSSASSPT